MDSIRENGVEAVRARHLVFVREGPDTFRIILTDDRNNELVHLGLIESFRVGDEFSLGNLDEAFNIIYTNT